MPLIPYPNVPNVPGVPNVLRRAPAGPPPVVGTIAGIAQLVRAFTSAPVWGVFKHTDPSSNTPNVQQSSDGLEEVVVTGKIRLKPVVTPDSIRDFGYTNQVNISTAPTQNGSFADYNRVNNPFEVTLRMTKGGTERDRQIFLNQIEQLQTTQLYDVITPEKPYRNVNLMRIEYQRQGEKGAFWLSEVDLTFREIRIVTIKHSRISIMQPTDPSAANPQNNGTQQAQVPINPPTPKPGWGGAEGTW